MKLSFGYSHHLLAAITTLLLPTTCLIKGDPASQTTSISKVATVQVPSWSTEDLDFFLHGTMSTEIVPESVFRSFIQTYPDLFPRPDLSNFGLIPDAAFGWPIGFSRLKVPHLGGLSSVGINCAACHVGEVSQKLDEAPLRVLGVTSHFDAEAFFGALIGATFLTSDPANLRKFLSAYLTICDPKSGVFDQERLATEWSRQQDRILAAIAPFRPEAKSAESATLYPLTANDLRLDGQRLGAQPDLPALSTALLQLFHNMRWALHVPDQPPATLPPASGPGRNDAFGLLSAVLFGAPQPYAPVKYGLVWNLENRYWVHWDGNTRSPLGRNLLAALGLGAPLLGKQGQLDFAAVKRHTDLSERIKPPKYPFTVDQNGAKQGEALFQARCASCHGGTESDKRLFPIEEIGTEPQRGQLFTQVQADRFNQLLFNLETAGYEPFKEPGIRSTQKYWASSLAGVWARSPYLHNGSVRTMLELLSPPARRAKSFHRGSQVFDLQQLGYADEGPYLLDTATVGNSNAGHEYGVDLSDSQKRDLIEYLKTL